MYFHEKYYSKIVFFSPFLQISAHAKHIFTTSYVFVMVKKGAHIHTKKNFVFYSPERKVLSKYKKQKKNNLKKKKKSSF